ncbi:MAG: hypothetical protein ACJ8EY_03275 [Sphingomicrobium sp.]
MKKSILAAMAVTTLSFNTALSTPAFALPPVVDTTGLSPQEICDNLLKPNDPNSQFHTYPGNIVPGAWTNDGAPYADEAIGDPEGYGTPTYSNVWLSNSYFRNGGSPNVWAMGQATITYPQTRQLFSFLQDQTQTIMFDCVVEKTNPAGTIEPAGLQSVGNSATDSQTVAAPNDYVITNEPFVVQDAAVTALICISPNNVTKGKPGTWTGKHGFNAANCPAASLAAGGTVPSGNAPDLP